MKSTNRVARIAATLLCLAVFVSASFAKTYPLNQPSGLAVATNGDLYVANEGGNEVLVYSADYSQIAGKTITQGINSPTAVAFDGQGNLWVGNLLPSETQYEYFSEYSAAGKQINPAISEGDFESFYPTLAVDGVGDVWALGIYKGEDCVFASNAPTPYPTGLMDSLYIQPGNYTAVAARGPWVAFGTLTNAVWELAGAVLTNYPQGYFGSSESEPSGVVALTFDANFMLYVAAQNGFGDTGIQFIDVPAGGSPDNRITLSYVPSGMAADSVHQRLYVANSNTNQIQVYSTTSFQLLTTIQ